MKTAIVILNWNSVEFLRRWLPALIRTTLGQDAEIIVADNASSDGSVEMLEREFPQLRRIVLDSNYGFTGGYNRALAQIDSEYYLLINSDIEVEGNWLKPLIDWMDSHPECGVCGPKLHKLKDMGGAYLRTDDFEYAGAAGGYIDRYGFPFCRGRVLSRVETDHGQYGATDSLMWVSGACMMTRRSLWERLGGLDERFFAHMEEIDYCWRAQLAGYRICMVPESVVWHLGGGTLPQSSPFKLKLNYRNNLLMLQKNLPATIGIRKARRRIALRRALDKAASCVYLLSGKKECADAVRQAHREAAELADTVQSVQRGAHVEGYRNICIILQSIIRGGRIFKYLKDHEDSHSRRR